MGLPLFRIEIQKSTPSETWSNDYLTDDLTMNDAQDLASVLLTWERQIHQVLVNFDYIRISSYVKGDRTFRHLTLNEAGLLGVDDHLPLYCTLRMDMQTQDSDPCRKYYRMPVKEVDQQNGKFLAAPFVFFNQWIDTYLVNTMALEHIVSNKGNKVISANLFPYVQMRQLHRRRKAKVVAAPGAQV
jgi:hypothetical protein